MSPAFASYQIVHGNGFTGSYNEFLAGRITKAHEARRGEVQCSLCERIAR